MFQIVKQCLAGSPATREAARKVLWQQVEAEIVKNKRLPQLGRLARDVDARREVYVRVMGELEDPQVLRALLDEEATVKFWTFVLVRATWRAIDYARSHDEQLAGRREHEYRWAKMMPLEVQIGDEDDDASVERWLPTYAEWVGVYDELTWIEVITAIRENSNDDDAVSAFVQHFIVDLSWKEIAAGLDTTRDAIRVRVMRMIEDVKTKILKLKKTPGGVPARRRRH